MTGTATALAVLPAAEAGHEFPGVLCGVWLDGAAVRLARVLDPALTRSVHG